MNIQISYPEDWGKTKSAEPQYRAPAMPEIETVDDLDLIEDDEHELDGANPTADNVRRASFAAQAVLAYGQATGSDLDTVISDLLGDMQHLLDVLRESGEPDDPDGFGDITDHLDRGSVHYEAEIRGEL